MAFRFVFSARSAHSHQRQTDNGYANDHQRAHQARFVQNNTNQGKGNSESQCQSKRNQSHEI